MGLVNFKSVQYGRQEEHARGGWGVVCHTQATDLVVYIGIIGPADDSVGVRGVVDRLGDLPTDDKPIAARESIGRAGVNQIRCGRLPAGNG